MKTNIYRHPERACSQAIFVLHKDKANKFYCYCKNSVIINCDGYLCSFVL